MTDTIETLAIETAKLQAEKDRIEALLESKRAELKQAMIDGGVDKIPLEVGTWSLRDKANDTLDEEGMKIVKNKPFTTAYWKNTINMKTCLADDKLKVHIISNPTKTIVFNSVK